MSLIEIVCQNFTDEAAVFPMVHTNEKQSSCLPGKVTLFQQNIFVLILLFQLMFSGREKKNIINYLQKFPIYSKIRSFLNHAESMFNNYLTKKIPESNNTCIPLQVPKNYLYRATLVPTKIKVFFFTHLLHYS